MNDWFRCTIRDIRGKEIEVYFADFGIVDVVDISDIRLEIALEKLSACCNTSIWCAAVEHNVMFQEEAVEGELAVTVKAAGSPLQVELLYKSEENSLVSDSMGRTMGSFGVNRKGKV